MDTQKSPIVDVPNLKLAKVGKDRDRKKAGGAWSGARAASSAFSGATGGAGMGVAGFGGLLTPGLSIAKILAMLLLSGGVIAGAMKLGMMSAANAAAAKSGDAPKVFADKDASKSDIAVFKGRKNSIPNSLGYVNNDGLTDEQRAAQKAAEDAAAAKAAADAQAKADADAKAKALADATAAGATPAPAPVAAKEVPKVGLGGGKFGGMGSLGSGGGGGGGAAQRRRHVGRHRQQVRRHGRFGGQGPGREPRGLPQFRGGVHDESVHGVAPSFRRHE